MHVWHVYMSFYIEIMHSPLNNYRSQIHRRGLLRCVKLVVGAPMVASTHLSSCFAMRACISAH